MRLGHEVMNGLISRGKTRCLFIVHRVLVRGCRSQVRVVGSDRGLVAICVQLAHACRLLIGVYLRANQDSIAVCSCSCECVLLRISVHMHDVAHSIALFDATTQFEYVVE